MTGVADAWTAAPLPGAGNPEALEVHLTRWRERGERSDDEDLKAFVRDAEEDARGLLAALFGNSPFLSHCMIIDQPFARLLVEDGPDAAYAAALGVAEDDSALGDESRQALMKRLRVAKRRAALAIGAADVASAWPLAKVTGALSDLASACLEASCRHLLRGLHDSGRLALPDPAAPERDSGLIILGMGKLGARELNYSSDIDLIVLFDQDAVPYAADDGGIQQVFTRLARNLVSLMDERTADGYVFRTDLRLRPDPGSTAPALSTQAAEVYYESAGQNWERAAMIKARPVAGDAPRGDAFLEALRPFIWRRHLDFAAIQDIQSIKRQINAHRGGARIGIEGHNIKLGRGGIREIEFFAQTQQLIWGGRDPTLRARGTLETLRGLVAAGHLAPEAEAELAAAYEFCRGLEHRLQMVDDRQTHSLPDDADGLARIAAFSGYETADAFSEAVLARLRVVERHYAGLFEDQPGLSRSGNLVFTGGEHDPDTLATLASMGYADSERASGLVRSWHTGRYGAVRSTRARELLTELVPAILDAFADSPDPDAALLHFDRFLARLPVGLPLFSMFAARPALFELVAEIMASAPRLADWLSRHPGLLDSVLAREFADLEVPDSDDLAPEIADSARRGLIRLFYSREFGPEEMRGQLADAAARASSLEGFLDAERRWANDRVFQIGVHMLRGLYAPVEAGRPFSNIADACLGALMPVVADDFAEAHGRVPGSQVALVAFGRLGSREMTVASDVDLLFVYDHDPGAAGSDGPRPLAPSRYYANLCRRFVGSVTAPTADGKLYEVDMRLRPSGNAGPIATSLDAFAKYQEEEAWTWEHQALTRGRVIWAEGDLGERLDGLIRSVLSARRDQAALAGDVADMRERVWREHGSEDPWAVRQRRGGLVEVEFAAQFLQLLHAADVPEILARDPVSVFEAARTAGLIEAAAADELVRGATLWSNLQGILRLTVGGAFAEDNAPPGLKRVIGRACGIEDFDVLRETVRETAAGVEARFRTMTGAAPGDGR